jgi:hypothetical protein
MRTHSVRSSASSTASTNVVSFFTATVAPRHSALNTTPNAPRPIGTDERNRSSLYVISRNSPLDQLSLGAVARVSVADSARGDKVAANRTLVTTLSLSNVVQHTTGFRGLIIAIKQTQSARGGGDCGNLVVIANAFSNLLPSSWRFN